MIIFVDGFEEYSMDRDDPLDADIVLDDTLDAEVVYRALNDAWNNL